MKPRNSGIEVSIVIPVKNGEKTLTECLDAVYRQRCRLDFEVIAIDSGSTDRSLEILGKYPVKVVRIKPEEFGHGKTRNLGARMSASRFIVYLTQDAIPANEKWLQSLIDSVREEPAAGAYSRNIPRPGGNLLEERKIIEMFTDRRVVVSKWPEQAVMVAKSSFNFSNVSSIIKRDVWERIPFDDRAIFAEDQQWAAQVLKAGYKLVYEPSSKVLHSHDYSIMERIRRSYVSPTGSRNLVKILLITTLEIIKDWDYVIKRINGFWKKSGYIFFAVPYRYLSALAYWLGSLEAKE